MRVFARLAAAVLALLLIPAAFAQTFPSRSGTVVDQADIIPPEEERGLNQKLDDFEERTGHQIVVATVDNLEGYDVADYATELGRTWGVGRKGADDGVIILVAPNERRMRIAVGYGLESAIPMQTAKRVIDRDMVPAFKRGDFADGIDKAADSLISVIEDAPEGAIPQGLVAQPEQATGMQPPPVEPQATPFNVDTSKAGDFPKGLGVFLIGAAAFGIVFVFAVIKALLSGGYARGGINYTSSSASASNYAPVYVSTYGGGSDHVAFHSSGGSSSGGGSDGGGSSGSSGGSFGHGGASGSW